MSCRSSLIALVLLLSSGWLNPSLGQDIRGESRSARDQINRAAAWKMETLKRSDGRMYQGLLQKQTEDEVKFAEVKREGGKPMYIVVHYYHPNSIDKITRLKKPDRDLLMQRIGPLLEKKSHARIEAGRMEEITLSKDSSSGRLRYVGNWFALDSRADEENTRRCIVRIEQIFRAYMQVIPPRVQQRQQLKILLHGSMDEYRDDIHRRDLQIDNPAFFSTDQNLIVAASELTQYAKGLAKIRTRNQAIRDRFEDQNRRLTETLNELRAKLKQAGVPESKITEELNLRRNLWKREFNSVITRVKTIDRWNDAIFQDVTQEMFRRLYHEAFHAYLENFVYPHGESRIPRWLNEGLAQIFENSQLDGDTLRIDAPSGQLVRRIQDDLKRKTKLSLAELLTSQRSAFLITHDPSVASKRHYLYSWGLAYYLTFEQDLLGHTGLDEYVSQKSQSPIARFEILARQSLPQFEQRWKTHMQSLKPAR